MDQFISFVVQTNAFVRQSLIFVQFAESSFGVCFPLLHSLTQRKLSLHSVYILCVRCAFGIFGAFFNPSYSTLAVRYSDFLPRHVTTFTNDQRIPNEINKFLRLTNEQLMN